MKNHRDLAVSGTWTGTSGQDAIPMAEQRIKMQVLGPPEHATPPTRRRMKYRAARAFYITLFLGTCYATFALLGHAHPKLQPQQPPLHIRHSDAPFTALDSDDECRLVHRADDQCAFVRSHCPADEGGFSAYLELFYCRLGHAKPVAFIILILWLGLLFSTIGIAASDFFCIDLSTIAAILGMSESLTGVTFLAFGNGSPDVFSTFAAMSTNSGSLAVGELFGAAGFITAVVSGSMALIKPFHVGRKSFVRDVCFFTVAAAFSLFFIWDGKLRFWECLSMVLFYLFYVVFVVVWHWWLGRRRRRKEREAAIRSHFVPPGDGIGAEEEEYRDDPEESGGSRRSSVIPHGGLREDWSALERASNGDVAHDANDGEVEEGARDRWMSELASNMRLTRPALGTRPRGKTITPVRPSLVGALEFQAVLSSLQKSRNIQPIPVNLRRFSDDASYQHTHNQDFISSSTLSTPSAWQQQPLKVSSSVQENPTNAQTLKAPPSPGRLRTVSANDAAGLRLDPEISRPTEVQAEANLMDERPEAFVAAPADAINSRVDSPSVRIHPATPLQSATRQIGASRQTESPHLLAPPESMPAARQSNTQHRLPRIHEQENPAPEDSFSKHVTARDSPKLVKSPDSVLPFPQYRDSPSPTIMGGLRPPASTNPPSLYLPGPLASHEGLPSPQEAEHEGKHRPLKWWPYSTLPPPRILLSTLFPTIYHWREKNWWEKCLGVVAAPSVFFLTITLPVVENEKEVQSDDEPTPTASATAENVQYRSGNATSAGNVTAGAGDGTAGPAGLISFEGGRNTQGSGGTVSLGGSSTTPTTLGQIGRNLSANTMRSQGLDTPTMDDTRDQPDLWNRWLTITQLFLAPIFIVLAIYLQSPTDISPSWLVKPILISLLVSFVLLIPLLLTTTPTYRPNVYQILLSLVGFVVSVAWISTIASQVVGALKALAVILNMSHAIMGLTIFAVGNSMGDLVADVTVARLGYPVMALSACLGGPMLNILLGVGLSGSYLLLMGAENGHEKHPEKGIRFKSYHIDVSKTLIVSGITLLVTLVGLLIVVPLNRWVLSRKIGWALIALWTLSTIGNVVIEITSSPAGSED